MDARKDAVRVIAAGDLAEAAEAGGAVAGDDGLAPRGVVHEDVVEEGPLGAREAGDAAVQRPRRRVHRPVVARLPPQQLQRQPRLWHGPQPQRVPCPTPLRLPARV
ncbi:hypothetical protein VTG60DRAFT_5043 [Thermothelomyces hinnuleus]